MVDLAFWRPKDGATVDPFLQMIAVPVVRASRKLRKSWPDRLFRFLYREAKRSARRTDAQYLEPLGFEEGSISVPESRLKFRALFFAALRFFLPPYSWQ